MSNFKLLTSFSAVKATGLRFDLTLTPGFYLETIIKLHSVCSGTKQITVQRICL